MKSALKSVFLNRPEAGGAGLLPGLLWAVVAAGSQGAATAATGEKGKEGPLRVAYVSVNEALEKSGEQKRIRQILQKDKNSIQKIIQQRSDKFKKDVEKMKAGMALLSEEEKMKKSEEVYRMQMSIEQFVKSQEMELQRKDADLKNRVVGRIRQAAGQVAKKNNIQVIRNRDGTLWVHPDLDLTPKVVRLYKSKFKKKPL